LQDGQTSGGLISTTVLPQLLHFQVFSGMAGFCSVIVHFSFLNFAVNLSQKYLQKGNLFADQIFLILILSFGNQTYYLFFRGNHGKKFKKR
jgi:hypothetical protein